jgi:hypothetical protein
VPDYSAQMNIGSAEEARFTIIGADHRNMCRFSSSDDPQFRQVAAALSHMAEGAVDGAKLKEAVQSQGV